MGNLRLRNETKIIGNNNFLSNWHSDDFVSKGHCFYWFEKGFCTISYFTFLIDFTNLSFTNLTNSLVESV